MAVVSYRLYCQDENCSNQKVIKKKRIEDSNWKLVNLHHHKAVCPSCNPAVDPDDEEYKQSNEEVAFEKLDAIGEAGADNLRENGIVTRQDVADASDEEILDTSWVGEKGLQSIRHEVQ